MIFILGQAYTYQTPRYMIKYGHGCYWSNMNISNKSANAALKYDNKPTTINSLQLNLIQAKILRPSSFPIVSQSNMADMVIAIIGGVYRISFHPKGTYRGRPSKFQSHE